MLPGARDIVTTVLARAVAMIGPFGVSIITARVLGPEDRGQYFLIVSYAQIAAQMANLGLQTSNTYLVANKSDLVGRLLVNSFYVAAIVTPIVALAIVIFVGRPELLGLGAPSGASLGPEAFMAVLLAPLIVLFLYIVNMAVGIGKIQLFNGLTILSGVAAVGTAAAVGLYHGGTTDFLFAAAGAVAVSCVVGGVLVLSGTSVPLSFDIPLFRKGALFGLKVYVSGFLSFLMMRVGVIALQQRSDLLEIGQFSIATQIADALILLPGTVGLLLFPSLLRMEGEDRRTAMWRVFRRLGALMIALLIVGALLIPWILPVIFGVAYQKAVLLTLAMLPSVLIVSMITVLSQYLAAEGYPWRQVTAWLAGFAVQAGLSYWLAGEFGGFGVAIALAVSAALVFVILLQAASAMRSKISHEHSSSEGSE
ncbi:oligosaccharide flippase family protein [Mesorhizobium sp. ZC-5]|uniref:oligosaccharide flippase family protein n=1 Tax=Mesorhizobium sp. ZC-5 TaxID=2986066 RepID=UPI0021E854E0|nr:oligosaccharide flippase family protein [Mesorhizobium sp. ZC-5]MCV3243676.1 polysaccharide biosynthesis C-terminal domain-containing protein [Mesorhizobium sp. ZC-5]